MIVGNVHKIQTQDTGTTLSSCPFAAWFLQKQKKKKKWLQKHITSIHLHTETEPLSRPTCVSWPAAQVYKAEGSFCWWGAAAPPSVGDNSSPALSGTLSGPGRSGSYSYARHLHTFNREVSTFCTILSWTGETGALSLCTGPNSTLWHKHTGKWVPGWKTQK